MPALKFTNPSCIIVVPLPIYAPSLNSRCIGDSTQRGQYSLPFEEIYQQIVCLADFHLCEPLVDVEANP